MTDFDAIRARDEQYVFGLRTTGYDTAYHPEGECEADRDRHALLAEVDRLTAEVDGAEADLWRHIDDERARILAAVEAEYAKWPKGYADDDGEWCLPRAAVIDAIKGETT